MPDSEETPPGRLARTFTVVRWVVVGACMVLVALRFGLPYLLSTEPDMVQVTKGEAGKAEEDLKDKLVPPGEPFSNPVARQLVDIGKDLVARPRDRQQAAEQLLALTDDPEKSLGDDMTAYLALRSAYWQLRCDPDVRGSLETAMLLWDTAEHLESNSEIAAAAGREDDGTGVK